VSGEPETPFDSIEGTYEYLDLLSRAIDEARWDITEEIVRARTEHAKRRRDALQLVAYKLQKLHDHITRSRRIVNDLRTLRRLLLEAGHDFPPDETD
jgi:hypothetical protein